VKLKCSGGGLEQFLGTPRCAYRENFFCPSMELHLAAHSCELKRVLMFKHALGDLS